MRLSGVRFPEAAPIKRGLYGILTTRRVPLRGQRGGTEVRGAMGWSEKRANGKYRACWRDGASSKRYSPAIYRTAPEARRFANSQEQKINNGEAVVPTGRGMLWSEWLPKWTDLRGGMPKREQQLVDRYLLPYWGGRKLHEISRGDVQGWVNALSKQHRHVRRPANAPDDWTPPPEKLVPISAATVERIYQLFAGSMTEAATDGPIVVSPCKRITRPTIPEGQERYLTREEGAAILDALNEPWRSAVLLYCGTGTRFGELAGLHWQRVDFAAGTLTINETWHDDEKLIVPFPKSKHPRVVPMVDFTREVLERLRDEATPASSCGHPHKGGARCRSDLVITGPKGAPLDNRNLGQRYLKQAAEQAGVGHVRLHDMRHTYASWLIQDGVPLEIVKELLGHADIRTTLRYAKHAPDRHSQAVTALSGALSASSRGSAQPGQQASLAPTG